MNHRLLIFVPTYNESENISRLYAELKKLPFEADLLFLDDDSPDGTGNLMDALASQDSRLSVIHRQGKQGIGSAHREGILWAESRDYDYLLTMDADFTHNPIDLPRLWAIHDQHDLVLASRYLQQGSLKGWNLLRRGLTTMGHLATKMLLGLSQDATGALRVYDLKRLGTRWLGRVESNGYGFFFESLFEINQMRADIAEVPIKLPPRTYGHSKMNWNEVRKSLGMLFQLALRRITGLKPQLLTRRVPKSEFIGTR